MGRSDKPKFSTIFTSHWPDDGTDYDSDFADDRQPDISTDEESMMSGDAQVIAEGRASQAGDSDDESEDEAGEKGTAVANEDVAIHDSSGEERPDTSFTALTDEQVSILSRRVSEFRTANLQGRLKIITACVERIKRTWAQSVPFNEVHVEMHVRRYFYNRRKSEKHMLSKKWVYKDVLVDVHRVEIDKLAAELSKSKPGSPAYLGCYRKAIKAIEDTLDDDTRQKYRAQAKKWSEQKPPPQQQQRMFEKHGLNALREFSGTMYRQYGVRVAVLAGYCDGEGEPTMLFHDINNELGGTSFKSRYKNWPKDPMVKDFSKWTAESFGVQPCDSSEDDGKGGKKDVKQCIALLTDEEGFPILPSWEAIKHEGISYKRSLTAKFIGDMYRIAGAGGKGRIPWARMKGNEEDYILPEYLPEGIPFSQFHHMHLEDLNSLLQHWTQRQAAGDIPFRFKKLDRLGKRELAADNTPTGVGPGDQSESEPQDAREDQEQEGVSGGQGDPGSSAKEAPDRQGQDTNGRPKPRHNRRTSNKRVGQVVTTPQVTGISPGNMSHGSDSTSRLPEQQSATNNQTAADDPQALLQPQGKKRGATSNTSPSKRRKGSNHARNVEPEIRRSGRTVRPTEWAKVQEAARKRGRR